MSITGKDISARGGKERKSFFDRLRAKADRGDQRVEAAPHKLPPIADIVASAGRPTRDKP